MNDKEQFKKIVQIYDELAKDFDNGKFNDIIKRIIEFYEHKYLFKGYYVSINDKLTYLLCKHPSVRIEHDLLHKLINNLLLASNEINLSEFKKGGFSIFLNGYELMLALLKIQDINEKDIQKIVKFILEKKNYQMVFFGYVALYNFDSIKYKGYLDKLWAENLYAQKNKWANPEKYIAEHEKHLKKLKSKRLLNDKPSIALKIFKGNEEKSIKVSGNLNHCVYKGKEYQSEEGEAIAKLLSFEKYFEGFKTKSCANCKHFRFSGMSHDMSGGWAGYCWLRKKEESKLLNKREKLDRESKSYEIISNKIRKLKTIVNIVYLCKNFELKNGTKKNTY
jgi:hypothetical protein